MKTWHTKVTFLLLLLLPVISSAERVVLVLSGGGARGMAHIGVLRNLEERGIVPDLIIGTSIGAIVGGLYAVGQSPQEIEEILVTADLSRMLTNKKDRRFTPMDRKTNKIQPIYSLNFDKKLHPIISNGIFDGQLIYSSLSPVIAQMQTLVGDNFDSLPIPLRVITTNIETGQLTIHSQGDLVKIIKASSTIPAIFPPVEINGTYQVDGGITANLPLIDSLLNPDDIVIAVDITSPLAQENQLTTPLNIILQLVGIGMHDADESRKKEASCLLTPPLKGITNNSFDSSFSAIAQGYHTAEKSSFLDSLEQKDHTTSIIATPTDSSFNFTTLTITGNKKTKSRYIQNLTNLTTQETFSTNDIKRSIHSIYGSGLFTTVHASAVKDTLIVNVNEKPRFAIDFGLRADQYHLVEAFIAPTFYNIGGIGMNTQAYFQIGYLRKQIKISLFGNIPLPRLQAIIYDLSAYASSEQVVSREVIDTVDTLPPRITYDEFDLSKIGINTAIGWDVNRVLSFVGGFRLERYGLARSDNASSDFDIITNKDHRLLYAGFHIDYLDDYYFPQKGGSHTVWFSGSSKDIGADNNFFTFNGSHLFVMPIVLQHVFIANIMYSWADQNLPAISKYYLGGGRDQNPYSPADLFYSVPLAGVREHALPTDQFLLLSLQYRFQFTPKSKFYASLYLDWAYGWDSDGSLPISYRLNDFLHNAPLALETEFAINTFFGPIRTSWSRIVAGEYPSQFEIKKESLFRLSVGFNF